ncbi:MAG: Ig-like domain-containing protein, partial [bacterium]
TVLGTNALTLAGENYETSLTNSTLAIGVHSITVTYLGDSANQPSSSDQLSQTVLDNRAETATALALSAGTNPSDLDTSVTFTATVSGSTPTGVVQFYDGATLLGDQPLADAGGGVYQAGLTNSTLAIGLHSLTAHYVGDSGNKPSTSDPLSHMVTGPLMLFGTPGPWGNTRTDGGLVAGTAFNANTAGTAKINRVGFWDEGGDGLASAHVVGLFERDLENPNYNWKLLAKATVPAGTAVPLIGGYRWVNLETTITLTSTAAGDTYGRYAVLAETGTDAWYGSSASTVYSSVDASIAASLAPLGSWWSGTIGAVGTSQGFIGNNNTFGAGNIGYVAPPPRGTLILLY